MNVKLEHEDISTILALIDLAIAENNKKFSTTNNMNIHYWSTLKTKGDILHNLKAKLKLIKV